MSLRRPVHILGGGLAGLSLGVGLRQAGVETIIFEAGDYPRHRVCGEFMTGLDEATIRKLGIASALGRAGFPSTVAWYLGGRPIGRQVLPSPARALSRLTLDARLAELFVAAGGILHTGKRLSPPADPLGWVDTCGRRPMASSPWIGLKVHARDLAVAADLEMHLGDGSYVGLSRVEDGWTNVCGLFRRRPGLRPGPEQALSGYLGACGLGELADRLASAHLRPGSPCAVAGLSFASKISAGDGLRLGDACAMIAPFTGNGMSMAFTGASLALDPLVAWAREDLPWAEAARSIRGALNREFRLRLGGSGLLHPFLLNPALRCVLVPLVRTGLLPLGPLYTLLH